jgi:hypothetical protein
MSSALWTSAGLDCGTSDPFIAANRAFAALVPDSVVTFDAGGHDDGYWRAHGIRQLEWFAQVLPTTSPA